MYVLQKDILMISIQIYHKYGKSEGKMKQISEHLNIIIARDLYYNLGQLLFHKNMVSYSFSIFRRSIMHPSAGSSLWIIIE